MTGTTRYSSNAAPRVRSSCTSTAVGSPVLRLLAAVQVKVAQRITARPSSGSPVFGSTVMRWPFTEVPVVGLSFRGFGALAPSLVAIVTADVGPGVSLSRRSCGGTSRQVARWHRGRVFLGCRAHRRSLPAPRHARRVTFRFRRSVLPPGSALMDGRTAQPPRGAGRTTTAPRDGCLARRSIRGD